MTLVEPQVEHETTTDDVDPAVVAAEIGNVGVLKRKSKVRAFTPLPGVPEGTEGRVVLVNGWDPWIRYHVMFDNGVNIGSLNREHLVPAKQWDEMVEKRRRALESGAFEPAAADEVAEAGGAEGGAAAGGAVVNGVSIPQHLIERSAAARARLAG